MHSHGFQLCRLGCARSSELASPCCTSQPAAKERRGRGSKPESPLHRAPHLAASSTPAPPAQQQARRKHTRVAHAGSHAAAEAARPGRQFEPPRVLAGRRTWGEGGACKKKPASASRAVCERATKSLRKRRWAHLGAIWEPGTGRRGPCPR